MTQKLHVSDTLGETTLLINEVETKDVMLLAHGAGAGITHPFMESLATGLSAAGISVIRYNFPYMEQGKKRPDPPRIVYKCIEAVLNYASTNYPKRRIWLAGKSFGGRMSSNYCAENHPDQIEGLLFYGFPLHPLGKPGVERAAHLSEVGKPMLFLQGERDKMADLNQLKPVIKSLPTTQLEILEYGDHSFKTPKKSGISREDINQWLVTKTVSWINSIS